jgi:glycosyltransferase involved in cell wall biosynthesis
MKILMLIPTYYPFIGGAEVFAQEIAERSVREGNEVDVITSLWEKSQKKTEVINGVSIYRVKVLKRKYGIRYLSSISYVLSSVLEALRLDKRRNYDLIHSVMESSGGLAGTMVKKFRHKPHLVTMQGGFFLEEASLFRRITIEQAARWCFKNADIVHGISHHLVEERADRFGARKTVVIPNGADMQMFHPMNKPELKAKYSFPQDERIILSVCPGIFRGANPSFNPEGYPNLIEAFATLTKLHSDLRLVIIGEGYKRATFKDQATKLGIEDKVSFMGFVSHEELPYYFNLADVFIRPRVVEGQGIVYVEAMACGVPVIGANVGGTFDVIEHGKNGLLVSPHSVEDISGAIRLILEDETTRNRFITEGLKTVEQKFRWETIFDEINQIYIELARGKGGK